MELTTRSPFSTPFKTSVNSQFEMPVSTVRDAMERLSELVEQARIEPKVRRPTKPTRASKQRRLEGKQQRGQIKRTRGAVKDFD